jgi:magnesium transporter
MEISILHVDDDGRVYPIDEPDTSQSGWQWIDITADVDLDEPPPPMLERFGLDTLAVHDAFRELDLPKFDDFGDHVLIILHGLREEERIRTYELDCFVLERTLITVHHGASHSVEALWAGVQAHPELVSGGCSELAARLADGVTRRLLAVVDAFDQRVDELVGQALVADRHLLNDVAAVRADLSAIRRIVYPQRETLDVVRTSDSPLLSPTARRRFSDVFDVASRTAYGLDAARSALKEAIDAYRGAEAREATEVSRVLTIYAAILLPLSLIVGFFGMNHPNLPTIDSDKGWIVVSGSMLLVVAVSFGVFVSQGWVRRPSGRKAGATLGRGLAEAARAPVHVAGAVFEISTLPLRSVATRLGRLVGDDEHDD